MIAAVSARLLTFGGRRKVNRTVFGLLPAHAACHIKEGDVAYLLCMLGAVSTGGLATLWSRLSRCKPLTDDHATVQTLRTKLKL
jgi:hypothetical protein